MRPLKLLGTLLAVALVLAVAASSATALTLPNLSLLPGEEFPVTIEGESGEGKLETEVGGVIVCTGSRVRMTITVAGSLGTYEKDFTGCKMGTMPCNTEGDPAETMLLKGEVHLVPLNEPGSVVGVDYLTTVAFVIVCGGKTKVKEEGAVIGSFSGTLGSDITSFKSKLEGAKGKQELTSYFNDEGKQVTKVLPSANFGLGPEQADLKVAEMTLKANKMINVTG